MQGTFSKETSVTRPSGPASEESITSVFAPFTYSLSQFRATVTVSGRTEFNASTKSFLASSLSRFVSRLGSDVWSSVEAAMVRSDQGRESR
jgi:hypothetical protein